jgi:glycosyltransferase involved in cell wall biosynthesis
MPVYNEAPHLGAAVEALVGAVAASPFEAELVLVDDGSTDLSGAVVERALAGRLPLTTLSGPNRGRFRARREGIEAAKGKHVLLLDGRVSLRRGALAFVAYPLLRGEEVWNGHVHVRTKGNPFGTFGNVLVEVAWADYFRAPSTTSYGLEKFDRYPKGTSCFLAPRALLLEAYAAFAPRVPDLRLVSDDTQLIRWIAGRRRIHLSPEFACDYQPRGTLRAFLRNAVYRGSTFVDGHGRRESRFFPLVVAFFPLSVAAVATAVRRPHSLPLQGAAVSALAGGAALVLRRRCEEVGAVVVLTPLYLVAHGIGMWRAAAKLLLSRLR